MAKSTNIWVIDSSLQLGLDLSSTIDMSGRGNNLSSLGLFKNVPGKYGAGGGLINQVGASGTIGFSSLNMTICGWYNTNIIPSPVYVTLINSVSFSWEVRLAITGRLQCIFYQQTGPDIATSITTTPTYVDGQWHHYAAICNAGKASIYVDGVFQGTDGGAGIISILTPTGYSLVGTNNFTGTVDEYLVFGRVLSATEIAYIYNSPQSIVSKLSFQNSGAIDTQGASLLTMYAIWDAGVTAGQVVLEGSPDGTNWVNVGTLNFSAGNTNDVNVVQTHRYIRVRVSTAPVGGNVKAWITMGGFGKSNDAGFASR